MAGSVRIVVVAVLLMTPVAAPARGLIVRSVGVTAYYYPVPFPLTPVVPAYVYPPVPVTVVPVPTVCPPTSFPGSAPRPYAAPAPAPPSTGPAPPATPAPAPGTPSSPPALPVPNVGESRRYYEAYPAARTSDQPTVGRYRVGFWNLSAQDLTLKVGENVHVLPRGRSVTLELGREFTWQVVGREALTERIPSGEAALELIIRR